MSTWFDSLPGAKKRMIKALGVALDQTYVERHEIWFNPEDLLEDGSVEVHAMNLHGEGDVEEIATFTVTFLAQHDAVTDIARSSWSDGYNDAKKAVLDLHYPHDASDAHAVCDTCQALWPCATAAALGVQDWRDE